MFISPLTVWCVFFCFGIVAGHALPLPFVPVMVLSAATLMAAPFFVRTRTWSRILIFAAAMFLGACDVIQAQALRMPAGGVILEGTVTTQPRVRSKKDTSFSVSVPEVSRRDIAVRSFKPDIVRPQDRVRLRGRLCQTPAGTLFVIPKSGSLKILRRRTTIKAGMEAVFARYLEPVPAGLYAAMILGDKYKVPPRIKEAMIATGTWHIMVVSGSHTALLVAVFFGVFKIFRVPRRPRICLTIALTIGYCLLTGASSPVVRATVMTTALLLGFLIERQSAFYHALALAALVILVGDPLALFDAGFQLSFLSVFFIVWLFPRLYPAGISPRSRAGFFMAPLIVSLCAWTGTAPLLAGLFGRFSTVTVIANIAVVPLAMLMTAAGFTLLALGFLCPPAAPAVANSCVLSLYAMVKTNELFARLPFAWFPVPVFPAWALAGLYAVMVLALSRLPKQVP